MNKVDFNNEDEVKEYLQNLGTEYSYQCYSEKTPEGCFRLGDFFAAIKSDFTKAAEAYTLSCEERGFGKGCNKVAALYIHGKGVEKSTDKAFKYFEKGCSLGNADACHGAGLLLQQTGLGPNNKKDIPKAVGFLEKSCKQGYVPSCFHLSSIYIQGADGVNKNMKKAAQLAAKCCDNNHMYACANLSRMYMRGDGVEKDEAAGKQYREKAEELHKRMKEDTRQLKFGE
ncbi:cytochrome c oxidase assembly factor 7-like [Antedon mediterranea]|uniref:cytochrome c oxidase assembly factor 7-like n=1 Tax=Antedon mediterranea TaxID=105859 RepID=UPI003AF835D0